MTDKSNREKGIMPALLIIDVQKRYLPIIPERDREMAIYFINMLIKVFRDNKLPVIRIYHRNDDMGPKPGTDEFEYPSSVLVTTEDPQVIKTYSDSFNKTKLLSLLNEKGCNTVFLCGLSAVGCVLATRTGAYNNDLKPFIVKDAIMSHNTRYTKMVESMFDAISFDAVKLIAENV